MQNFIQRAKPSILALSFFSLGGGAALSAPSVGNVTGTATHGQTLTISGANFGSKTTPAPLIFDTFENGSFNSGWANTTGLSINADNNRGPNSARNAYHDFKAGTSNDVHNAYLTAGNSVYPKWHVSYWFKLAPNWDWGSSDFSGTNKFLANIKLFRLWNPGSTNQNFVMATEGYSGNKTIQYGTENVSSFAHVLGNFENAISKGAWHHFQFDYSENSGFGANDGVFKFWFDGSLVANNTTLNTRTSGANTTDGMNNKRPFIIGFYNSWSPSEGSPEPDDAPNEYYMDDVYMDNAWARVEIGNNPSYNSCTIREEQRPVSWSSSLIQIVYNEGALSGNKYLFVVDNAGAASAGFLLGSSGTGSTGTGTGPGSGSGSGSGSGAGTGSESLKSSQGVITPGGRIAFGADAVEVTIRDGRGRLVLTKINTGGSGVTWNGKDASGRMVESGLYICRIKSAAGTVVHQAIAVSK